MPEPNENIFSSGKFMCPNFVKQTGDNDLSGRVPVSWKLKKKLAAWPASPFSTDSLSCVHSLFVFSCVYLMGTCTAVYINLYNCDTYVSACMHVVRWSHFLE